jgi:titin
LVTWASTTPPVDTGGAPILSYNMQYSTSATGSWLPITPYSVTAPTTTYLFTGLTNGIPYYFQVRAINMNGAGPYSNQTASSTATPSITPQAPSPINTTATTSSSITLSWTAPTNTGGNPVTGYLIYWSQASPSGTIIPPINSYTISGTPPATTYTITGLTHATLYAIQISSISCSGVGPISAPALYVTTSSIPPTAPTNVAISGCSTGYTDSVILTWTAPIDDGGSPIINYIIYYRTTSPVGIWYTYNTNSDATTAIVPLPSSGTSYDFKVAAQNIAGVSVFSSPIVTSAAYTPPTAPTNLVATNDPSGYILLTWTPSTQAAPQTISYYVIQYKICEFGGWITYPTTIPSPTNSATIDNSNIANNISYLFRVYAVNSCGARSNASNIVTASSYNNSAPTRVWSRFNLNCSGNIASFDNLTRDMLRKAEVLQYSEVGRLQYSRASLWSMAAKNQLTRQKAWASQSQEYTYPNITNVNNEPDVGLRQTPTSLVCWTPPPSVICNSSTASDVPGKSVTLCLSKNAPFNNFRRPTTYASGGTKWPVFFSK